MEGGREERRKEGPKGDKNRGGQVTSRVMAKSRPQNRLEGPPVTTKHRALGSLSATSALESSVLAPVLLAPTAGKGSLPFQTCVLPPPTFIQSPPRFHASLSGHGG